MVFRFCFSYGSSGTVSGGSSNYDSDNDDSSNDDSSNDASTGYTADSSSAGLSVAVIIGIVIGSIVLAAIVVTICAAFIYGCSKTGQDGGVITPVEAVPGRDKCRRRVVDIRLIGPVSYFTN